MSAPGIAAVNYHLWQPCNMHCRFCFATFHDVRHEVLPEGHLSRAESLRLIDELAQAGFVKITFAGGEPLLCPWLAALVERAKLHNLVTCVVTNGSLLTTAAIRELAPHLDLLTLSVDTLSPTGLSLIGRTTRGRAATPRDVREMIARVRAARVRLRINTVVTRVNRHEDLGEFIAEVAPERWKIMQVLPIEGQNSRRVDALLISANEFVDYVARNEASAGGVRIVAETNEDMTGSYAMVDPAGRFFDNVDGHYTYSEPVLQAGVERAIAQVRMLSERFIARGGQDFMPADSRR